MEGAGSADLLTLLSQAKQVLAGRLTAELAAVGISPRAQCVLSQAMTGDRTQTQVADACGLDKTTMVDTVDELERAGLAVRRLSSADRRARIVALTPAGRRKVAQAQQIVDRVYAEVLGALPTGDRHRFVASLDRLVAACSAQPVRSDTARTKETA